MAETFIHDTVVYEVESNLMHVYPVRTGKPFSIQFEFRAEAKDVWRK